MIPKITDSVAEWQVFVKFALVGVIYERIKGNGHFDNQTLSLVTVDHTHVWSCVRDGFEALVALTVTEV